MARRKSSRIGRRGKSGVKRKRSAKKRTAGSLGRDVDLDDLVLTASILATRDVVCRLLAYAAGLAPDQEAFLKEFSSATDDKVHHVTNLVGADDSLIPIQEAIRRQIDWYVTTARKMLSDDNH